MWSIRLWMLLVSVSALAGSLSGCDDEQFPERCGRPSECRRDFVAARAGRAALERDGGSSEVSARDASVPDASEARADAGSREPAPDDFTAEPQCPGPTRYFAPGCPGVAWAGSPEHYALQISPGCYRPCMNARDPICGQGTRCGRAAFAATACNGRSCAPVCAETWLCLTLDRFPGEVGFNDWDAGVSEEDAGWW